jgi:hypothetical protein
MVFDLSDDEAAALAQLLRRTINDDPYPLSPRVAPLKAIFAKPIIVAAYFDARKSYSPRSATLLYSAKVPPMRCGTTLANDRLPVHTWKV